MLHFQFQYFAKSLLWFVVWVKGLCLNRILDKHCKQWQVHYCLLLNVCWMNTAKMCNAYSKCFHVNFFCELTLGEWLNCCYILYKFRLCSQKKLEDTCIWSGFNQLLNFTDCELNHFWCWKDIEHCQNWLIY
jgi:hypothetical protein